MMKQGESEMRRGASALLIVALAVSLLPGLGYAEQISPSDEVTTRNNSTNYGKYNFGGGAYAGLLVKTGGSYGWIVLAAPAFMTQTVPLYETFELELTKSGVGGNKFFNSDGFHCEQGTEDGYAPGPGDTSCPPHGSDCNRQHWHIDLSQLLRLIQFFNSGGYHACPGDGTEDGYCVGPAPN